MKRFSLRARLTLLLSLATLVSLGIAARVVDWRADSEMHQRFDTSLLARAQAFATLVQSGDNGVEVDSAADQMARFPGGALADWYTVTCHGHVVAQTNPAPPQIAVANAPRYANARMADGREVRVIAIRFPPAVTSGASACELRYALDREPLDDILHVLDWILLGSILGACVLVLILTPWLVGRGLRPLVILDRAMAGIGPDAPGTRLPASSTTELVPLVTRFNEVLARMDAGLARERQFASALAHEFRTRLAELRSLVEVEALYPSGRDLHAILAEVGNIGGELEVTVTALLQLTRIQSGVEQVHPESVPLLPLLTRLCARHRDSAIARGIRIESGIDCDQACTVNADPPLLEIVLDNLLGNAVAYAPSGGAITLRAGVRNIAVHNAAPALHDDEVVNFGRRFWRKDAHGPGHAGLGLALASAAAAALQMTLSFELADGVLRATLRWDD